MKGKYSTSLTMGAEDYERFKASGMKVIDVFRAGLSFFEGGKKVIKTKEEAEAVVGASIGVYGCGCKKEDGRYLCPKHSRY